MVDRADHRIGDTERQQAIDLLRAHAGAGRLTLDEFSDLAGDVFAAQTYGELDAVGRKLPPGLLLRDDDGRAPAAAAGPSAGTGPSETTNITSGTGPATTPAADSPVATPEAGGGRRNVVAIMCGAHPRGTWRPAARMRALAICGGAHIDLRRAVMPGPVVDITAWAVMGGVTITVAEGTRVELDGLVVMGGSHNATRRSEPAPDAPLVRVHARGMWGGVTVRNPSRRRHRHDRASVHGSHAVGHGSDTAEGRDHVAGHAGSLPELPQRILDDLDAVLHDRTRPPARVPRPGPAWDPSPADAPPAEASRSAPAPDVSAMKPPSGTLTMMVTDVADSTRLAERLGDQRWIGVIAEHNTLVREQVARHGGTEVKALGDGFLVVFPSARRAILAAVDVQQGLARFRDTRPETPVAVRIGLHTGEIVDVDGDVLGQNVVVASRIADEAAPGEIVVSGVTRDLTVSGGDITFGPADDVELKGLSDRWRVHRVAWSPAAPEAPAASPS
jgi:class 3 adenylate cyclase